MWLFGIFACRHRSTTWPMTPRNQPGREHVTCLRCGTEFPYSWRGEMKRGKPVDLAKPAQISQGGVAAKGAA